MQTFLLQYGHLSFLMMPMPTEKNTYMHHGKLLN
jgi:hypothetical protein